jgi:hypothetical protein
MAEVKHIVGSAEPLTPEETEVRLRELEEWGVDLSLVWASLQKTPAQRLKHMLDVLRFAQQVQRAWREQRANSVIKSDADHSTP